MKRGLATWDAKKSQLTHELRLKDSLCASSGALAYEFGNKCSPKTFETRAQKLGSGFARSQHAVP